MLESTIKSLPKCAGVYQFFDENDKLLYVGKAKNLSNRVKSYFRFTPTLSPSPTLSLRISHMISQAKNLRYIKLSNEHEAFILENSLIKQLKPKYNILLRDDKTYPYIMLDLDELFPRFEITRKIQKGKNIKYFGPYTSGANDLLNGIYQSYPLVQKKSCVKGKKACLFFQINRCLAPCEGRIDKESYKKIINDVIKIIYNPSPLLQKLTKKMQSYSENLNFEQAALLRDMIVKIKNSKPTNTIDLAKIENFDLLAVYEENGTISSVRFFIREGKIVSTTTAITHCKNGYDKDEVYKQMILSFYTKNIPMNIKNIYLAHDLQESNGLEILLSEQYGKKIIISNPKRGEKAALIKLALENAKESIEKQNSKYFNIKNDIYKFFELNSFPNTIEVFDNSHLSQSATVGAIVSWKNDSFEKSNYRHYHLQSKDEYSQMREILTKRAKKFDTNPPPDLWLIDGGKTLLDLATQIVQSSGSNIDILAIAKEKVDFKAHRAKGSAKDTIYDKNRSYKLSTTDLKLQFLQKLRDEAHRFAISFHRKTKIALDKNSSELKRKGLSDAKIKKLLLYFGTFSAINNATENEIVAVIGKKDTKKLYTK